jgi:hypothetical protein
VQCTRADKVELAVENHSPNSILILQRLSWPPVLCLPPLSPTTAPTAMEAQTPSPVSHRLQPHRSSLSVSTPSLSPSDFHVVARPLSLSPLRPLQLNVTTLRPKTKQVQRSQQQQHCTGAADCERTVRQGRRKCDLHSRRAPSVLCALCGAQMAEGGRVLCASCRRRETRKNRNKG